jgi:transposase InsO family protein
MVLDALEKARWSRGTTLEGLVCHSDAGSQFTSIRYGERLAELGAVPSIGSVGDSYDNALAEATNGLYKTELIRQQGPWRGVDDVEVRMGAGRRAIDRDAMASYDVRGRAVLVHTGWDRHWGTERYGTGNPFLTAVAADWLVEQQAGLGRYRLGQHRRHQWPVAPGAHSVAGGWHPDRGAPVLA